MASPTPSNSDDSQKKEEQVSFRFCSECSNLLYPHEDKDANTLKFKCRTCNFIEDAPFACTYRNEFYTSAGDTAGVTQDVGSDPTLPRSNKACPKCKAEDAVFFQSQQRTAGSEMKLYYVCCGCGHVFN